MKRVKAKRRTARKRATKDLDRERVIDTFAAPSAAERARFERARGKSGRPKDDEGAHVISVSVVEHILLAMLDELARQFDMTRAGPLPRRRAHAGAAASRSPTSGRRSR